MGKTYIEDRILLSVLSEKSYRNDRNIKFLAVELLITKQVK